MAEEFKRINIKITKSMMNSYLEQFIDEEIMDEKTESTYNKYKLVLTKFIDFIENEEVKKKDMIAYKKKMQEKYATKTINNYIVIINKFMKFIELMEVGDFSKKKLKKHISDNYSLKAIREQEKTSLENVLEPSEFKRMLKMAKKIGQQDTYMIMKVFGYTGIRLSELKFFTLENIQEKKGYIEVYNKGKLRQVPLRNDLRRELLKYAKENKIEQGYLFPGVKDKNKMLAKKTIENRIKKICGQCRGISLEKAHPHAFRHMFGIQWVHQNGQASLSELAKIMGHGSIQTTAIYTNTSQQEKKRKVEAIKY